MHAIGILLCALLEIVCGRKQVLYGHEDPRKNIVPNWDMEDPFTDSDWRTERAQVTRTENESYTGNYSAFVCGRTHKYGGLIQKIDFGPENTLLKPNHSYYLSTYIKFANNATEYIRARLFIRVVFQNKSYTYQEPVARLNFYLADGDWNQIGGDLFLPRQVLPNPQYIEIFMEINPTDINYYLDTFALTRITELGSKWKTKLGNRIKRARKRHVNIYTTVPSNIPLASTRVEINMTRPWFKWGPALANWHLAGDNELQQNLKAYMKKYFSWAGFTNAMKWLAMEKRSRGWIKYSPTDTSVQWLLDNDFPVRGHTLLWGIKESNPSWLWSYKGQQLVDEMMRRINYTVSFWKGDVSEWDVYNEYLTSHYYEEASGIKDISLLVNAFKFAHSVDPSARLCINEYQVLRNGQLTSAAANLVKKLKANQAPVGCLGAQSHLRLGDAHDYNIDRYLKRLQIASAAGVPVTVSEFSLQVTNVTNRAAIAEKLFYAIFSEPKVQGVIFWAIGDDNQLSFEEYSNFVSGVNFEPNEAGLVLQRLLGETWRSQATVFPRSRRQSFKLKLFHGQYTLTMYVNNTIHKEMDFTLEPAKRRYSVQANF